MATTTTPIATGSGGGASASGASTDPPARTVDRDPFQCAWDKDLARAGVEPTPSAVVQVGIPAVALAMLALALVLALLAPDPGREVPLAGITMLLAAAAPWALWLLHGDDGPSWWFTAVSLAPVLALGIGHWFIDAIGLGSAVAYPVLAFPGLLLAVVGIAVAPAPLAIGMGVAAWISFGGPLLAASLAGKDVAASDLMIWNVVLALGLVAGYAVRFSYRANAAVTAAREALAWQAAAEDRRQVARDVHDVVAHTLAVTMLHITAARMAVHRGSPEVAIVALEEAERQGRASLGDIRRIIRLLRADESSALEVSQPGLADIAALVDGYRSAGLGVDLTLDTDDRDISSSAALALYRVLQEALTNAARHGSGGAIVQVRCGHDRLVLDVENPARPQPAAAPRGSGLAGMRERIAAAGGTIETGLRDGRWKVRAAIPVEAAPA